MPEVELNVTDAVVKGIINEYINTIRNSLINGETVEIPGIGKIRCKHRKVRNSYGREYAIKVVIDQDKGFKKDLLNSYVEDPEKFSSK